MPVRMLPFAGLSKPDTLEEALAVIDRANEMLSEAQGHREVYDRFVGHRTCFHTQHIALELNTAANILNKFLTEEGIQEKTRKGWVLRNGYRHLKANIPDDWINPLSKAVRHNTNYAWTPDAREYIIDLWYEKHNIAR
mgnify:CR=1 FL=1